MNPDSILISIKKVLGIDADYDSFDVDVILHANSVFAILNQLGVGPKTTFSISSDQETWSDFLGERTDLAEVKSYMYLRVRMLFDPPSSSFVLDAMKAQAQEIEWRLRLQAEEEGG